MRRDEVVGALIGVLNIAKASPYWNKEACQSCAAAVVYIANSLKLENDRSIVSALEALQEKIK